MDFWIKRGDRYPSFAYRLDTGKSIGAGSVKLIMTPDGDSTPKVNATATIVDSTNNDVRYDWGANDTDTAGLYNAEWEITYADGKKQTYPAGGYLKIRVFADLA